MRPADHSWSCVEIVRPAGSFLNHATSLVGMELIDGQNALVFLGLLGEFCVHGVDEFVSIPSELRGIRTCLRVVDGEMLLVGGRKPKSDWVGCSATMPMARSQRAASNARSNMLVCNTLLSVSSRVRRGHSPRDA
jgi:hypothetical protein